MLANNNWDYFNFLMETPLLEGETPFPAATPYTLNHSPYFFNPFPLSDLNGTSFIDSFSNLAWYLRGLGFS